MNIQAIRTQIKKKGLKQTWISDELGIHKSTLNKFLTGRTVLNSEKLLELLKLIGLPAEQVQKRAS